MFLSVFLRAEEKVDSTSHLLLSAETELVEKERVTNIRWELMLLKDAESNFAGVVSKSYYREKGKAEDYRVATVSYTAEELKDLEPSLTLLKTPDQKYDLVYLKMRSDRSAERGLALSFPEDARPSVKKWSWFAFDIESEENDRKEEVFYINEAYTTKRFEKLSIRVNYQKIFGEQRAVGIYIEPETQAKSVSLEQ